MPPLEPELGAALLAASSEAFLALDAEGRVSWANPAGLVTLAPRELPVLFESVLDPVSRPAWGAALGRALRGERVHLRVECATPPGALRVLALHIVPAPRGSLGAQGVAVLVLGSDVTELERARRAEQQVLAGLERLSRGAHVLAHDVKNPVAALNLALRAVARNLEEDEVAVVEDLAQRLVTLERTLRQSLGYLRPIEPRLELVGLEPIVEGAVRELAPEIAARGALLERELEPGLLVLVDPALLGEALVQMVRNALEAGARRTRIRARADRNGVDLEVEDDGPGILPSVRGTLFEPFVTTKEGASGLGLATARRLVEAQGGRLELAPAALGGALLRLHFERGGIA